MSAAPVLFRRRHVWLPTLWGWLLLFAGAALIAWVLGRNLYSLLAISEPARGPAGDGARTLVIEGWLDPGELAQAVAVLRGGHYERVLTTGGPIDAWSDAGGWHSFAQRAAATLRERGVTDLPVIAIVTPLSAQSRTFLSAVMVRDWARQSGVRLDAIDVFTGGVHARRSRLLYRLALGDEVEVGVVAAHPMDHDGPRWWTSSLGAKNTVNEALSVVWTSCCFWPGPPGSHDERWAVPAKP